MNYQAMISTPGIISILRKLYIQNDGVISADELLLLQNENSWQLADIEDLFASILCDLTPVQNLVLPFKEVNRLLILQKAIESKESSSVCQEVLPHLYVLKENLDRFDPDCELSVKAAKKIQQEIRPFAEKLPKLVKALNDYALLCEKYFSDVTLLERLIINIRLLPLADEANKLVEKNAALFTVDVYWYTAELLYKNSLPLFNDNPFNFSVVRAFLNEAIAINKLPVLEIVLPESLSLPKAVVEEPVAVVEEPVVEIEVPAPIIVPPVQVQIPEPIPLAPQPVANIENGADHPTGILRKRVVIMAISLIALIVLGGSIYFFFRKQSEPVVITPSPVPVTTSQGAKKEQKQDSKKDQPKPVGEIPKTEPKEIYKSPETSEAIETPEVAAAPKGDVSSSTFDALLKKAKGGNAATQYQVAQCYEKGTGVKADLFEAITWYRKAKVNGSEAAAQRLMELGY